MHCLPKLCAKDLNSCEYRVIISVECWPTGPMSPYLKLQSSHSTYEYMKVLNASFLVHSTPQSASDVCHHPVTHINLLLVSSHQLIRDNHSHSFIHQRCRMWSFIWSFMYYSRNSDTHKDPHNVSPELGLAKITQSVFIILYITTLAYIFRYSLELLFLILLANIMRINTILEHI